MTPTMSAGNRPVTPDEILNRIRGGFTIDDEEFDKLSSEVDNIISNNPVLRSISDGSFLQHIDNPNRQLIKRSGFISPKVLFLSRKIKSLCRIPYPRENGDRRPCGGIEKNYLACSPYSPKDEQMQSIMGSGNIFCLVQADGLTDMLQQRHLNDTLLEIEDFLHKHKVKIVMSFAAGPCRVCERCAGEFGDMCYQPDKMRFSLESCGIDVDWAMKMMARKTGDSSWLISWIRDFGLLTQDLSVFKSVLGILLK